MKRRFTFLIAFLISCFLSCNIYSTNVSGIISSNTIWTLANSPYIVTGNVLLDSGYTLTIQPGVVVKFDSLKCLQIGGTLTAIGTSGSPITFTSNQANHKSGYWGYILFNETSVSYDNNTSTGCIMQYCVVEYGGNQHVSNCDAVIRSDLFNPHTFNLTFPYIDHCTIRYNDASGVKILGDININQGLLRITNCDIHNNTNSEGHAGGGIYAYVYSSSSSLNCTIEITGNRIHDNIGASDGGAIWCGTQGGTGNVSNNLIYNNSASVCGGLHCVGYYGSYLTCSFNTIYNNSASYSSGGIQVSGGNVQNNIIVNNKNTDPGPYFDGCMLINSSGSSPIFLYNNTVVDNIANGGLAYIAGVTNNFKFNTITRNTVNGTAPLRGINYSGDNNLFQYNNLFNNAGVNYDFYNNDAQSNDVDARYNWWGTINTSDINSTIWDYFDDGALSIVHYTPILTSPDITAPVTPPVNVVKTDLGGGNIQISWNTNPETDIAGYKVHWGSPTGYSFSSYYVAGNVTSCILNNFSINDTVAVTAYDTQMDGVNDQFEGHESWFTYAIGKPVPSFTAMPVAICPNDSIYFFGDSTDIFSYSNTSWHWTFPGGYPASSNLKNQRVAYAAPGNYNVKLKMTNIAGSDSVTYNNYITVKSPTYSNVSTHLCNQAYYNSPSGNYTWISSGIYHDTIPNHVGCDSILTIHLTLNTDSYNTINPEACHSYTSPSGNHVWTTTAFHYDTIANHAGCDSIISINLTVYNPDTSVTIGGNTLTSNASGVSYQWLNCGNGYAVIPGEINQSFSPLTTGNYAVQVTQSTCADTSSCHHIVIVGLNEFNQNPDVYIYPNPAREYFTVIMDNSFKGNDKIQIRLFDLPGKELETFTIKNNEKISRDGLSNGVYFYEIFDGSKLLKRGKIILE